MLARGREDGPQGGAELRRQTAQDLVRPVDDGDRGAHADRDRRRVGARYAAAENQHVAGTPGTPPAAPRGRCAASAVAHARRPRPRRPATSVIGVEKR